MKPYGADYQHSCSSEQARPGGTGQLERVSKRIGDTLCADTQGRAVLSKVARLLEESRLLGAETEPSVMVVLSL